MARQYNPQRFFRQAPNNLLSQYFEGKGVLEKINFEELTETKIKPIYDAWLELPEKERNAMEKDFREIDSWPPKEPPKKLLIRQNGTT